VRSWTGATVVDERLSERCYLRVVMIGTVPHGVTTSASLPVKPGLHLGTIGSGTSSSDELRNAFQLSWNP